MIYLMSFACGYCLSLLAVGFVGIVATAFGVSDYYTSQVAALVFLVSIVPSCLISFVLLSKDDYW